MIWLFHRRYRKPGTLVKASFQPPTGRTCYQNSTNYSPQPTSIVSPTYLNDIGLHQQESRLHHHHSVNMSIVVEFLKPRPQQTLVPLSVCSSEYELRNNGNHPGPTLHSNLLIKPQNRGDDWNTL